MVNLIICLKNESNAKIRLLFRDRFFKKTAAFFSPTIAVQLIGNMIFLASSVFQMDLVK